MIQHLLELVVQVHEHAAINNKLAIEVEKKLFDARSMKDIKIKKNQSPYLLLLHSFHTKDT